MRAVFLLLVFILSGMHSFAYGEDEIITIEATIVGNQEQPKVLHFVPWQKPKGVSGLDESVAGLIGSQALAPIDRDEFVREVEYFQLFTQESVSRQVQEK